MPAAADDEMSLAQLLDDIIDQFQLGRVNRRRRLVHSLQHLGRDAVGADAQCIIQIAAGLPDVSVIVLPFQMILCQKAPRGVIKLAGVGNPDRHQIPFQPADQRNQVFLLAFDHQIAFASPDGMTFLTLSPVVCFVAKDFFYDRIIDPHFTCRDAIRLLVGQNSIQTFFTSK